MSYFLLIPIILLNGNNDYIEMKFKTLKECHEFSKVVASDLHIKKPSCYRINK